MNTKRFTSRIQQKLLQMVNQLTILKMYLIHLTTSSPILDQTWNSQFLNLNERPVHTLRVTFILTLLLHTQQMRN